MKYRMQAIESHQSCGHVLSYLYSSYPLLDVVKSLISYKSNNNITNAVFCFLLSPNRFSKSTVVEV